MSKKIKQGQTKWKVVIYDPGKIEGYDEEYVGVVYSCFITKIIGNTIYYKCGNGDYICSKEFWHKNLRNTIRQAIAQCKYDVNYLANINN